MRNHIWSAVLIFFFPFVLFFAISQTWGAWTGAAIGSIGAVAFLISKSKSKSAPDPEPTPVATKPQQVDRQVVISPKPTSRIDEPPAQLHTGRILSAVGSILLIACAFLPWLQYQTQLGNINLQWKLQFQEYGILAIGALNLLICLVSPGKTRLPYAVMVSVLSIIALGLMAHRMFGVWMLSDLSMVSIGIGLFCGIFGAILSTVGGFVIVPKRVNK